MGEEGKSFGAIVAASVAIILGSRYLVSAVIVQLSGGDVEIPLLLDSTIVTGVAGVALVLLCGGFIGALTFTRMFAIVTFALIAVSNQPWIPPVEPLVITETTVAALLVLYLLLYNPIHREERSDIDEATSATRIGSTIR